MESPGFTIAFSRTYNSRNNKSSSFGRGWTFSYEGSVKDSIYSTMAMDVRLPDGSVQNFKKNDDGTFTASDSHNTLVKLSDGTYTLTSKDQFIYHFDTNGYLVKMQDRNGNTVTISVDNNGKVQGITDQVGRHFTVTYENGYIKTITDDAGNRTVTYEYLNNCLINVTDPMGYTTSYTYDSDGFLSEIRDRTSKLIESITYIHSAGENKDKVDSRTDAYGNIFTYSYDNFNCKTTITDSEGRQTTEAYDSSYSIINSTDAEGKFTVREYFKDSNGINKYSEEKFVIDRNGNKTQYLRDGNGNITQVTNPDSSTRVMTYDDKNNLLSQKDEMGKYTFHIYDSDKKKLVKKVQPLNGTDQYTDGVSDESKFAITTYTYYTDAEYQAKGLLKSETDPEGNTTTYTYDPYGNINTITDAENNTITTDYDAISQKIRTTTSKGYKTDYTYDKNGNLEKQVLNGGETTRITYDSENRKTKEVLPKQYDPAMDDLANHIYNGDQGARYTYYDNGKVRTVTNAENYTTSYTYDLYGNIGAETKPNGSEYTYEYDVMNRPVKVYFKDNAASGQVLLEEYSYAILTGGKTQKTYKKYLNDTDVAVTVSTYDYAGRLISQQNADNTTVSTAYNTNGTVDNTTDAMGSITYYKYDGLNRMTEQWTPFESITGSAKYTYTNTIYDKAGRKVQDITGKDIVALYGVPTQLITKTYDYYKNGKVKTITDNEGRKTECQYDSDGNISLESVYTSTTTKNTTEYTNNYLGKPVEKKVYIKAGDISGNDFNNNDDIILTTIFTYDKNGNLETVKTPDNVITTYTYDNMNNQTGVSQPGVDENGNAVTISTFTQYNWDNKPLTITDANGNVTTNSYNQRDLLEKVTDARNNTTAFYYDRAGRKIAEVAAKDFNPAKTLEQMNRIVYAYDKMDTVKTKSYIGEEKKIDQATFAWTIQQVNIVERAYKYDNNGNVVKELDALGYEAGTGTDADSKINTGYGTAYTYNLANKVITVLDPVSKDRSLIFTIKYIYDAIGRKTSETNAKGVITNYYYDDAGNTIAVKVKKTANDPEQTIKSSTYDFVGNIITQTDGNGNVTTFEYNALNKLRKAVYPGDDTIPQNMVTYQYDVIGNLKFQKDSKGVVDTYIYDNQGSVLSHTQQKQDGTDSITTSAKYDKNGNKRFEIDGNGNVKEFTYNGLNKVITEKVTVSGAVQTKTYDYDANGNQTTITDWRGNTTTDIYDSLNRLIEKKDPYNKSIQKLEYNHNNGQVKSYDALNNVTQYAYDKNNRLLSTTDTENHVTSQTYDNAGNIDTKKDGRNNLTTNTYDEYNRLLSVKNAKNETTSYTYDLNGNMLTQTDGKGNVTTFEYNSGNKITKRIDHGGVGIPAKTESYTYYSDGSLNTKTDRNGNTTTYTYDIHNRLLTQTVGEISISYTYDNNGNQLTMTDNTGTTTRTYDELNRVKTKKVPNIGTTTFLYDIIEAVEEGFIGEAITDPKGNTTAKVYDKAGRLKSVTADNKTTAYTYYDNGSRQNVVYPDGSKEEYTYYKDNQLKILVNKKADGTVIDSYSYTYDGVHNQLTKIDSKGTTTYTYDALNRLDTVTEPGGKKTTYTYDMAGNRATETITIGSDTTLKTYSYNTQNRLTDVTVKLNGNTIETLVYAYDNNGNTLSITSTPYISGNPQPVKVTTNTYDKLNQLTATVTPDGTNINNTYNGEGLRATKSVDGNITRYLYEYDKIVLETDGSGNQSARNVYGTNLLARTVDNATLYYMYNGHADVTALIDASNSQVAATYYYDAWGNITEQTGSVNNPFRYAGYKYDDETGLYYLNSRFYDPIAARFLQEDTYRGDPKDPLSLNLYTYCHNNPITYDDPNGHWVHIAAGALVGGVVNSVVTAVTDYLDDRKINKGFKEYAGAFAEGAVIGAVGAATGGTSFAAVMGAEAVAGTVGNTAKQYITKGEVDTYEALATGALAGLSAGAVKASGALIKHIAKKEPVAQAISKVKDIGKNVIDKVNDFGNRYLNKTQAKGTNSISYGSPVAGDNVGVQLRPQGIDKVNTGLSKAGSTEKSIANKVAELKKQGFREHHIISNKNPLTKEHELLDLAGNITPDDFLQLQKNKIYLPKDASVYPNRSIHTGKHYKSVSENLSRLMDDVVDVGRSQGWTTEQFNEALMNIIKNERQALREGTRILNKNKR